jgi:hypothetical protein
MTCGAAGCRGERQQHIEREARDDQPGDRRGSGNHAVRRARTNEPLTVRANREPHGQPRRRDSARLTSSVATLAQATTSTSTPAARNARGRPHRRDDVLAELADRDRAAGHARADLVHDALALAAHVLDRDAGLEPCDEAEPPEIARLVEHRQRRHAPRRQPSGLDRRETRRSRTPRPRRSGSSTHDTTRPIVAPVSPRCAA